MKHFILLALILLAISGKAQRESSTDYFNLITWAEKFLAHEYYEDALICYKKSFLFNEPFKEDVLNALEACYKGNQNTDNMAYLLEIYLMKEGFNLQDLISEEVVEELSFNVSSLSEWDKIKLRLQEFEQRDPKKITL